MTIARLRHRPEIEPAGVHEDWCACIDNNFHHACAAAAN
jgi:hypothetical protein